MLYSALFIGLLIAELIYFKIADKYNIIDKPNQRSSHSDITLRGGGVVFILAIIVSYFLGYVSWPLAVGVVAVGVVSFIDDIKPLSQLPRFSVHLIAAVLVIYDLGVVEFGIWVLPIALFLLIGWVNAFNFMDGINGITVLYALVSIMAFAYMPYHQDSLSLFITMGLSCLVFAIFNVRKKAKAFAGDVGSIGMAIFLGYFLIKTFIASRNLGYSLIVAVYSIDVIITILMRIKRKEKLLDPHRSHLYQYLANDMKVPHIRVSAIYAILQLGISYLTIVLDKYVLLTLPVTFGLIVLFTSTYCIVRYLVYTKYVIKNA